MANPWHDGEGKFCSQAEMEKAVEVLASKCVDSASFDKYFKLRKEYEEIQQGRLLWLFFLHKLYSQEKLLNMV